MVEGLVDALRALADPLRLRMVAILSQEELAVGELAEVLGMSQPRISHHLKVLRESGLIRVRREGAWTFCSLMAPGGENPGPGLLRAMEPWANAVTPGPGDLEKLKQVLEARRERSRSFFEEAAGRWESLEPRFEGSGLRHQALSLLLPGAAVLADVGCGSGFMAETLATRASKVILIDHSPAMLEKARAQLGEDKPAVLEFRVGELDHLPLADNEVDGAFVNLVLHHAPDLKSTLGELSRAIRPGGALVISDLLPHEEDWLREEHADLRLGLEPGELDGLARSAGFTAVRVEGGVDQLRVRARGGQEAVLPLFVMRAQKAPQAVSP